MPVNNKTNNIYSVSNPEFYLTANNLMDYATTEYNNALNYGTHGVSW